MRSGVSLLRVLLAAAGAVFGWWLGILLGSTVGAAIGWFASPLAGRIIGGLLAGLIAGAIESPVKGKRMRFSGATALATSLAAVALLDVQILPWLVGGAFGAAIGAAQATALRLPRRDAMLRALTSSAAWALGFVVLHDGGAYGKVGIVAPGLAVVLLTLANEAHKRGASSTGTAILPG